MRMVKLAGLGAGEEIWVNPDQVGALLAVNRLVHQGLPLTAKTLVYIGGVQIALPGTVDEIRRVLEFSDPPRVRLG